MTSETEEAVRQACIIYNDIMRSQPEDCRDQPAAMRAALSASQAEVERLTRERDEARGDADDLKERLHDVVMLEAEAWAIGGGPGFKDRKEKAWNRAREPFEP